jgi:hypothetical protein
VNGLPWCVEAGRVRRPGTAGYGTVERSTLTMRTRSASLTAVVLTLPRGVSLCRDSGLYFPSHPPCAGRSAGYGALGLGFFVLHAVCRVPRVVAGARPRRFGATLVLSSLSATSATYNGLVLGGPFALGAGS